MTGVLYWPAGHADQADPAGRADLAMMMRAAAATAAPLHVDMAESPDQLDLTPHEFLVISDAHLDETMVAQIKAADRLRWIQLSSSGAERAVAAGLSPTIALTNAATVWAPSVADHAVALLLGLMRQIPNLTRLQAARTWSPIDAGRNARTLTGATAVILGCGAVGCEIASRVRAFGVRTIGVNRAGTPSPGTDFASYSPIGRLSQALTSADILFVSIPLRPETRHLIGTEELRLLGPHGYLINVARGAIVEPDALENAVASDGLAGVGLDVTEPEPLPADSPLWNSDRVIISPHMASMPAASATGRALGELIRENGRRLHQGRELLCRVT